MGNTWRVIVEEGGKLRTLEFDDDSITIGRTNDNAVKISDALSSRHHCQIQRSPGGFLVEDLKSRNGTKLNGQPLTEKTELSPGDKIQVGDSTVHFAERAGSKKSKRAAAPKSRRSAPAGAPLSADGPLKLLVIQGEGRGKSIPVSSFPFVLGRKKGIGLTLADNDVSNEHCMIVMDEGVLHVVDLGSTNGTFLNGQRLKGRAPLKAGLQLRLGATLTFSIMGQAKAGPDKPASKPTGSKRAKRPKGVVLDDQPAPSKARPKPVQEVEEIDDLDALDDDMEVIEDEAPSNDNRGSAELVAQEADILPDLELGQKLEEGEERLGRGGGIGVALVAVALLLVVGSIGYAAKRALLDTPGGDPAPDENLLANWSFEKASPTGPEGWELAADESRYLKAGEVRYGRRALALKVVKAGTRPELRSVETVRVTAGKAYDVRGWVSLDPNTFAALRVDWLADEGTTQRQSVAVLTDPASNKTDWEDIGGVVVAPPGATKARVVGVAAAVGDSIGEVRFDRLGMSEAEAPKPPERLKAPSRGLTVDIDERGVMSLRRQDRLLARGIGLALLPNDGLSAQTVARIDQPLGKQTDESLLALGAIPSLAEGVREEYVFTARAGAEGIRVRWSLNPPGENTTVKGPIRIRFQVDRLTDLGKLELDGVAVADVPADGLLHEKVGEMAWGSGKGQVSFSLTSPADVTIRKVKTGGVEIALAIRPGELATGRREVGFDILAASQRTRETIRRLLRHALAAKKLGNFSEAQMQYQRVVREFRGENWEAETNAARAGLADLAKQADRLVDVVKWAVSKVERLPHDGMVDAGRSAVAELEQGFPGSSQLTSAKTELNRLVARHKEALQAEQSKRVAKLVNRAKALREAGRLHMARAVYRYVVEQFDADVPGVTEAKNRLSALPPEKE